MIYDIYREGSLGLVTSFRCETDADNYCREWKLAGIDLYYIATEA